MPSTDVRRPDKGKRSFGSRLRRAIDFPFSFFRKRSSSTALPQLSTDEVANPSASMLPSQSDGATPSAPASPRIDNAYAAIGGPPTVDPAVGSVVYEGLKTVLQGLYDCSDMFLPLKTATGGLLAICKMVDTVSGNKAELEDLKAKLVAVTAIVQSYKKENGLGVLDHRIKIFCEAIVLQLQLVEKLHDNPHWKRTVMSNEDSSTILKAIRKVTTLCEIFQIDTQLNIESSVQDILLRLRSGSIDKLYHKMISYKTRQSSYGDAVGCMPGTRATILADLERWALDQDSTKVYWMVGMAGIGKSSIAHTLCEMLDRLNILGANFFCSRASDMTNNARLIIPVIAHSLARAAPSVKFQIVKAVEDDPALAESTYSNLNEQFKKLVRDPLRATTGKEARTYKIIVIDAVDECVNLQVVSSFIRLILQSASNIPLKFFIASRDEELIRSAFNHHPELSRTFHLHDVEQDLVKEDIRKYIEKSLSDIKSQGRDHVVDAWPSPLELSNLVEDSGRLFIYAATALRYINDGGKLYRSRLSIIANRDTNSRTKLQTSTIDGLYGHILEQACASREDWEVAMLRQLVSIVVFLRNPLSIQAISSLFDIDAHPYLTSISSAIHVPAQEDSPVAPFHASFPDFVTDPTRCSPNNCPSFPALVSSDCHEMLALKCLEHMNSALRYNICDIPKERIQFRSETTNSGVDTDTISEALKYSCIYWASHLSEVKASSTDLILALRSFLHEHLLHWMECLSILGELGTVLKSLQSASEPLSHLKTSSIEWHDLQLLIDDARRFLQMNFEVVQKHCMEVYQSALVWIPEGSRIREIHSTDICKVPKLVVGLSHVWGSTELVLRNGSPVMAVAVSQNGSRVVSGSYDRMVRIWNTATGEVEAELTGHTAPVTCVAFSRDGSRIASGSYDETSGGTVHIWNAMTGELDRVLECRDTPVMLVAFSPDGSRVAHASFSAILIWNATTGRIEVELNVAFSPDGGRVASASFDETVRIWNAGMGRVEAELKGHPHWVGSVAFSQDGTRIVSACQDHSARIWNATTGALEKELKDHTYSFGRLAFSQDGSRVVNANANALYRTFSIWNATTGEVELELKGHTDAVTCAAFAQGNQLVSGSQDGSVRIWNTTNDVDDELQAHTGAVTVVVFTQDGRKVISASHDNTFLIWNTTTGEREETKLKTSGFRIGYVAFSPDGSRLASSSGGNMIRIWNLTTGDLQAELKGHTNSVKSIAFSQDGSRIVSGSSDRTVRIWNAASGQEELKLMGHRKLVRCVAFSRDGAQVVSGSKDATVRVWDAMTGMAKTEFKGHSASVAFSQDGSTVVSGAGFNNTIQIWDVMTGDSQLMGNGDSNHMLSDGSVVQRTSPNRFQIIRQPTIMVSSDRRWIVGPFHDCWIPPQYRDFTLSAFCGNKLCLGYKYGRVVIFDMTPTDSE